MPLAEAFRRKDGRAGWRSALIGQFSRSRSEMDKGVQPTREQRLQHFDAEIFGRVEGWLGDRMSQMVMILGRILDENQVQGHIAEFGVHHGLFLFLLNALRNDNEECFAIDVFDQQQLNIDRSGSGSLPIFLSHLEALMGAQRSFFRIVERDTTTFSTTEITELFGKAGVKFLSVDAGHTTVHACNDLHLAQEVLVSGGIVALDDYMSVHWPGVTEGFYRFMATRNRRFKPLMFFQNKLFLTTVSEQATMLQQFRAALMETCAEEVRTGRWKDVEIAGTNCLSFS